jgi:hypothetical protein
MRTHRFAFLAVPILLLSTGKLSANQASDCTWPDLDTVHVVRTIRTSRLRRPGGARQSDQTQVGKTIHVRQAHVLCA